MYVQNKCSGFNGKQSVKHRISLSASNTVHKECKTGKFRSLGRFDYLTCIRNTDTLCLVLCKRKPLAKSNQLVR